MTRLQVLTGGKSKTIEYKANKPAHTAPQIIESFVGDDGEVNHILDNGRTTSDLAYCAMWGSQHKAIPNFDKKFKGSGIDGRTNWIK